MCRNRIRTSSHCRRWSLYVGRRRQLLFGRFERVRMDFAEVLSHVSRVIGRIAPHDSVERLTECLPVRDQAHHTLRVAK